MYLSADLLKNIAKLPFTRRKFKVVFFLFSLIFTFLLCYNYRPKNYQLVLLNGYLYSKNSHVIRILAVGEKDVTDYSLSCLSDSEVVSADWLSVGHNDHCLWRLYFLDCPFRQPVNNKVFIQGELNQDYAGVNVKMPESIMKPVTVCFHSLYLFENWQIALSTYEYYLQYGADLLVVPIQSVIEEFYHVLKLYERKGQLQIFKGTILPQLKLDYNINTETEEVGRLITMNECFYSHKHSSDYIIFADYDELLLPRHQPDYHNMFGHLRLQYPKAGAFGFSWAVSATYQKQKPEVYDVTMPLRNVMIREVIDFGTTVIISNRTQKVFEYVPTSEYDLRGYYHVQLSKNESWSIKYIFPDFNPILRNITVPIYSNQVNRTAKAINNKFTNRIITSRFAFTKFMQMEPRLEIEPLMSACLRIQKLRSIPHQCINKHKCVPKQLNHLKCTNLVKEYHHSHLGLNRWFHSAKSEEFVGSSNCLLD